MRHLLMVFVALVFLSACRQQPGIFQYKAIDASRWSYEDEVVIETDTIRESGRYDIDVHLRITNAFPFQTLWLVVEQHWDSPTLVRRDTVECHVSDKQGDLRGRGLSVFQYNYPISPVSLQAGQYGRIRIRHIMQRKELEGIADVGIRLTK